MTQAFDVIERRFVLKGFEEDPGAASRHFKEPGLDPAEGLRDVLWMVESGLLWRLPAVAPEIVAYADGVLGGLVNHDPDLVATAAHKLPLSDVEDDIFPSVVARHTIQRQAILKLAETDPVRAVGHARKAADLSWLREKMINQNRKVQNLEPIDGVRAPWRTLIETLAMLGRSDPAAGLEAARTIWKETLPTDELTMGEREKEIAADYGRTVLGMIPEALPAPSVAAFATCYKWLYDEVLRLNDTAGRRCSFHPLVKDTAAYEKVVAAASRTLGPLASKNPEYPEYVAAFALCSLQAGGRGRLSAAMCAKHQIPLLYGAEDRGLTTEDYPTQRALLTAGLEATHALSISDPEEAIRYARAFHQVAPFLDLAHQVDGRSYTCEMEAVRTVALTVGDLVARDPERGLAVAQELWKAKRDDERLLNHVRTSLIEALPRWMPTRSVASLGNTAPWLMGEIACYADDEGKAKVAGFVAKSLSRLSKVNPCAAAFTALDVLRRKEWLGQKPDQVAEATGCFTTSLPKITDPADLLTLFVCTQSSGLDGQHAAVVSDLGRRLGESPTGVLNALAAYHTLEPARVVLGDTPEARAQKLVTLGVKPA